MPEPRAIQAVAANVRAARAARGLSIDRLAARSGVSKGALVAIERGSANPNLATLIRLADALAMSVSDLVSERAAADVRVVRADTVEPLWRGPAGGEARLLLTTAGPAPVEVWWWRLVPGEPYGSEAHGADITETITVLEGTLTLRVADVDHEVPAGATAAFPGDIPHTYAAAGDRPCVLLMTVHLPPHG